MKFDNTILNILFDWSNYDYDNITNNVDVISRMKGVLQSPIHHNEGDVWIHTNLVCTSLLNDPEFHNLNEYDKDILFVATLLHDVEKYSTTEIKENGKISSPKHAVKGAVFAYRYLKELGLDTERSYKISKLIHYHGLPIWHDEKPDPEKAVITSSVLSNNSLLYILAKADINGRHCNDKEELFFKIEYFREYCKSLNSFNQSYPFLSAASRFMYFYNQKDLFYEPFDLYPDFIGYLIIGLPGSGKDTYIKNNLSNIPVISLDDIRKKLKIKPGKSKEQGKVAQQAKEDLKVYLRERQSVIWNATNITKMQRDKVISIFNDYGAKINIIWIDTDLDTILKQNTQRTDVVPSDIIIKLNRALEVPDLTECYKLSII